MHDVERRMAERKMQGDSWMKVQRTLDESLWTAIGIVQHCTKVDKHWTLEVKHRVDVSV